MSQSWNDVHEWCARVNRPFGNLLVEIAEEYVRSTTPVPHWISSLEFRVCTYLVNVNDDDLLARCLAFINREN